MLVTSFANISEKQKCKLYNNVNIHHTQLLPFNYTLFGYSVKLKAEHFQNKKCV